MTPELRHGRPSRPWLGSAALRETRSGLRKGSSLVAPACAIRAEPCAPILVTICLPEFYAPFTPRNSGGNRALLTVGHGRRDRCTRWGAFKTQMPAIPDTCMRLLEQGLAPHDPVGRNGAMVINSAGRDNGHPGSDANASMSALQLQLLGSPQAWRNEQPISFKTRKSLALLAYLAVESGSHPREQLAALLWPDASGVGARASLRTALVHVRQ